MKNNVIINEELMSYHVVGEPEGNPIVFLHGWAGNGLIWKNIAEKLSIDGFLCCLIDLPGFGESPLPKKPFSVEDYSQIIEKFIEKLNLNNIILIGHSFGGRITIKLASKNPEYIKKIILVDSAGIKESRGGIIHFLAKLAKPLFKPKFMQSIREKIYRAMGSGDYVESGKLKQIYLNTVNEDLTLLLSKIKKPALIVWGENDKETPLKYGRIMNEKIIGSELKIIKRTGHYSFLDNPEEFYNIIKNYI